MSHEDRDRGKRGLRRADGEQGDQQTELRHGAPGQDQLRVDVTQRTDGSPHHGREPERQAEGLPDVGVLEGRRNDRDEDDAGLDHGRRVQVGADRCGCRHRSREPHVERELRRLRGGRHEDQDRRGVGGGTRDRGDLTEQGGARGVDEQHEAGEQRQTTGGGDHERAACCGASDRVRVLEPDEQERRDRGQFPEDEQRPHRVRPHQTDHRGREGQQGGGEPADARGARREVAVRVDAHERADARHEHRQQRAHRIDAEFDRQVEARHPLEPGGDHVAGPEPARRPDRRDRHRHRCHPQRSTAESPSDEGERHDHDDVQSEQEPDQQTRMIRLDLFASQH